MDHSKALFQDSGRYTELGIKKVHAVDSQITAIFNTLLSEGVSINDAFLLMNLSVLDARLGRIMDEMYKVSEQVSN